MEIETSEEFIQTLQKGAFAWPGGYPLYFITDDGAALSFKYAERHKEFIREAIDYKQRNGWRVVACEVNWEDPELYCEGGDRIESAYAD